MSVLGVLLEGFDETAHPRGFHGRWIGKPGGKVLRVFHGSASLGDAKPERGKLLSNVAQVAHDAGKSMTLAEARKVVNDAAGSPAPTPRVIPKGGSANELRGGIPRVSAPALGSRERGAAEVDAHMQAFKRGEVQRPRVRGDGRSGPIAPSAPAFDPVTSLGREGQAARERGASSATTEHADTRDKLANLPRGQRYGLHGPQGQVGHVERTAEGWHVVGSSGEPTTHKTPSSAAGAAMRIQRKAASSRENADVMARNYRGGREVERMNARQSQRATAEAERQRQIADRHGGFKVGDHVTYETGSREAGGHGPVTFTRQPGVHEVVGLQRNGNLRIRHPENGTTVDVHHSHATKVGPLHPEYRGAMVQRDYARAREKIAREKAARARVREAQPMVLGALLEGR